ncbi:hypothetical protein [Variovorax sp. YR216]|uniref:hypothetical protein n=1 Tax=Variovorax sp. YR216 TaxID=1882828 RepID=UPI000898F895|nr:hypothetical protein [Variovorax sp. YR216]SEB04698.1 hypothetical protein SAMN05444680_10693 [Variovorax sp. YR216]
MTAELQPPRFHGLRLALDREDAASVFGRILGMETAPRFHLGQQWIEVNATPGDALDLRCDDLVTRRTHLRRLGVETMDGMALGCASVLRLEPVETGACTVDLREEAAACADGPHAADVNARLCALELAVRAPERVALHWAQMFNAPTARDGNGLPMLALAGMDLRFAPPAEGRLGIAALEFATSEIDAWANRASGQGFEVNDGADRAVFAALGVAFRLRAP